MLTCVDMCRHVLTCVNICLTRWCDFPFYFVASKVSVPLASLRARWLLPAHYVLVDRGRREVVVAVRGERGRPRNLDVCGAGVLVLQGLRI